MPSASACAAMGSSVSRHSAQISDAIWSADSWSDANLSSAKSRSSLGSFWSAMDGVARTAHITVTANRDAMHDTVTDLFILLI
jgi:hypothetical protein